MEFDISEHKNNKSQLNLKSFGLSWETEGSNIIDSQILTTANKKSKDYKEAIEALRKLLKKKPLPEFLRHRYWMNASGATREKQNNKDYYNNIINNFPDYIPSRNIEIIEADISRTFLEDAYYKTKETKRKLRNILLAYSRRNTNVGYVQGFNFLVGRLLKITNNEEDTFWLFTEIIENILPVEYYDECCGLMGDTALTLKLLKEFSDKEEIKHIYNLNLEVLLNNLIYRWFLSLYVENTSFETFICIWDALFVDGNIVFFRAAFALLTIFSKDIIKSNSIEELTSLFDNKIAHFSNYEKLMKLILTPEIIKLKGKINYDMKDIFELRKSSYKVATDQIHESKKSTIAIHKKDKEAEKNKIKCNLDWPFCIDNEKENIDKVFVIRGVNNYTIDELFYFDRYIIEQRIEQNKNKLKKSSGNVIKKELKDNKEDVKKVNDKDKNQDKSKAVSLEIEKIKNKILIYNDLLIQRNVHCCEKNVSTFKDLNLMNEPEQNNSFTENNSELNRSLSLIYKRKNSINSINSMIGDIEKSKQVESTLCEINKKKTKNKGKDEKDNDDEYW